MSVDLSSRQLRRSVRCYVRSMGGSPEAVARRLNDEGVKGLPGQVSECALARYLQAVIGSETSVRKVVVKEWSVRVFRIGRRLPSVTLLPGPAARFIRAFDAGSYPELIDGLGVLDAGYHPGVGDSDAAEAGADGRGLGLTS